MAAPLAVAAGTALGGAIAGGFAAAYGGKQSPGEVASAAINGAVLGSAAGFAATSVGVSAFFSNAINGAVSGFTSVFSQDQGVNYFVGPDNRALRSNQPALVMEKALGSAWKGVDVNKCFPGATLILLADGTQKPISDIRVGDAVMAFDGFGALQARRVA